MKLEVVLVEENVVLGPLLNALHDFYEISTFQLTSRSRDSISFFLDNIVEPLNCAFLYSNRGEDGCSRCVDFDRECNGFSPVPVFGYQRLTCLVNVVHVDFKYEVPDFRDVIWGKASKQGIEVVDMVLACWPAPSNIGKIYRECLITELLGCRKDP